MKILALDSSTELCSVALWLDGEKLVREELAGQRHSELLLPMVQELLTEAGLDLKALDGIAFGEGPGSFTGLRIGLATALGLAFGTDRLLVPVPTLAALATQAKTAGLIAPVLDARRGEVYAGLYHADGREVVPDSCSSVSAFLARLPAGEAIAFLGGGVDLHRAEIAARLGGRAIFLPVDAGCLRAASVGRLGLRLEAAGHAIAPERVELRYLRRAEAESKRLALHAYGEPIP